MKTLEDYIREYDLEQLSIKNYYNLLRSCSENSDGLKLETETITQRVELIIKGLECELTKDDIDYIIPESFLPEFVL